MARAVLDLYVLSAAEVAVLTSRRQSGILPFVDRRKTTIYLDADVLTATKVLAATRGQSESQVVEEALRAYLASATSEGARADLMALMDRVALGAEALSDEDAMDLAVGEVRAVRRAGRSRRPA